MTFAELLELLNYTDTEYVGICHNLNGRFNTAVLPPAAAPNYIDQLPQTADIWYQVNPTAGPVRTNSGRGTATDVTRLAALWCDLDIKDSGCPTFQAAWRIISELADLLGAQPSTITKSGHGLQPYWIVDDGNITDTRRAEISALLRRWGRLVTLVASHHSSKVDNVYDLPRILRTPGTTNNKSTPVPVTAEPYPGGTPLSLNEIDERLNEAGIYEIDTDKGEPDDIISPPNTWVWGNRDMCTYWPTVVDGWKTDNPDARHPWLVSQSVRLAAAHRRGCLDAGQYADAKRILEARFHELCGRGSDTRKVGTYEVADAIRFGEDQIATMNDDRLAAELGKHRHLDEITGTVTEVDASDISPAAATNITQLTRPKASVTTTAPNDDRLATVTPIEGKRPRVATDNLTDTGNAELLAAAHGGHLRYCPEMGRWLSWDGACWTVNVDDAVAITAARAVIGALDPTRSKDHAKHKIKSLSRTSLEAMVALARRDPTMRIDLDRLDADPHALNTPAGIVNLRTGALSPHTAAGWHTKQTGVGYSRDLPAPGWHRFLQTTFGGDAELIRYVQRLAGYAAIGEVSEHVLPFLHGGGQNGKSVLLDVLDDVLGDYALTAPSTFLLAGQTKHETEIARLNGARLVVCSEVNKDSRFDEAKLKLLTGGDKLTGRFMHRDFFDFKPTHTLFLMGNHQPEVSAGGHSFWRRLRLIPFRHAVPADERNPNLARELVDNEGPAILAWIVAGAVDMLTNGAPEPTSVAEATEEYAEQEDALGRFLDECCHLGGGMTVKTKTTIVLARYQRWAKENGAREMNAVTLGRDLSSRFGIKSVKSDSIRFYPGLALVVEDDQQTGGWIR